MGDVIVYIFRFKFHEASKNFAQVRPSGLRNEFRAFVNSKILGVANLHLLEWSNSNLNRETVVTVNHGENTHFLLV